MTHASPARSIVVALLAALVTACGSPARTPSGSLRALASRHPLAFNPYDPSQPFQLLGRAVAPERVDLILLRDNPGRDADIAVLRRAASGEHGCAIVYATDALHFTIVNDTEIRVEMASRLTALRHGSLLATFHCGGPPQSILLAKPASGFADAHNHPFSAVGFDGRIVFGRPWCALDTDSVTCGEHGRYATLADEMPHGRHGREAGHGWPTFADWPRHDSWTHMMSHPAMLRRAVAGGMRLMVAHAVTNFAGCIGALNIDRGQAARCADDMEAVRNQIRAAYWTQGFVDQQCGTRGCGWFRIVRTPAEARDVMSQGKLAVVLGIEVDQPFGCGRDDPRCTPDVIRRGLDEAYACGVRHMFPIHFQTNAFGGSALSNPLTGPMADAVPCTEPRYRFGGYRSIGDFGRVPWIPDPIMETAAACNRFGLTAAGRTLVREMMRRGMLIDVDHMSDRAFWDTIAVVDAPETRFRVGWDTYAYPVVSGHLGMIGEAAGDKLHESNGTIQELRAIWSVGGTTNVIGRPAEGPEDIVEPAPPLNPLDPATSSRAFAQHFLYASHVLTSGVGIGSDMNGGMIEVGPRCARGTVCASSGCFDANARRDPAHEFDWIDEQTPPSPRWRLQLNDDRPLGRHVICRTRTDDVVPIADWGEAPSDCNGTEAARHFDFGLDGLAHGGMLADLAHDMEVQGVPSTRVDVLYRSAEEYVSLWERAEQAAQRLDEPMDTSALARCPWDIDSRPQCPSDRSIQGR